MSMNEASTVKIAGVQFDPKIGEVDRNLATMLDRLKIAAEAGAKLVAFPECALTGYCFQSREEALPFAQPADGPASLAFVEACKRLGVWGAFGFLESEGSALYNACALIGPDGSIVTYRKIHLPFMGVDRFVDPGNRPFEVQQAGGVKIGLHICYDGAFPESARILTLLGAELLVLPTNWPPLSECAAEHMIATRAMENVVYAMSVNRVGEECGVKFIGRSSIAATGGQILAFASIGQEEIIYADIEPAKARQKRLIRIPGIQEVDRIADRRPSLYGRLVEPNERH